MTAEFHDHSLVDLGKIFLDDPVEILRLQQEFETNGWCFLYFSQDARSFATQLNHINQSLTNFFALDQTGKSAYLSSNAFGYTRVNHKEGIKVLTDQHGNTDDQYALPMNINATLQHVSQLISNLTYRLKPIITQLTASNHQASKQVEISDLAMLDIVHYFNKNTGPKKIPEVGYDTDEVNCVPHYDPGLFSLSILSTCDGLQLKDQRTNKWIDGPDNSQLNQSNIGVLWLGEAASILTGNRFKAGIHRVVYPRVVHQARVTIWQEVCTESQIKQLLEQDNHAQRLPDGAEVMLANQPDSKPMNVLPGGETRMEFMRRVETSRGLSMSESGRRDLRISNRSTPQPNNVGYISNTNQNSVSVSNKKKSHH
jgi:isopenicillin N synthase-like dioxygenase